MAVSDRAPLLSLEDLHAAYGPVAVLRGLDLVVYPGELVCVIGANGAGKTSTLRAVSGLLAPTRGRIVFDGRPIHGAEPADVLAAGIAHCPEGRRVFPHLTVRENLEMGAYVRRDRRAVDEDVLTWFRAQVHAMGGGNYQTLINQALRQYVSSRREPLEDTLRRVFREELRAYRAGTRRA